jgi:hypothetical protein
VIDIELVAHGNLAPRSGVELAAQTDEVLTAAAIDRDGRLNVAWANRGRPWEGPLPIGSGGLEPWSGVALAKQTGDVLTAAAIGTDGRLQIAWVNGLGPWQGPVAVGPPILEPHSGVALAHQTEGIFVATAVGRNGQLHVAWLDRNGSWQGPVSVGRPVLEPWSRLALAKQGDKILVCAALGRDGTLHIAWVNETGNWQGPVPVGGPVLEPHSGIALSYQTGNTLTAAAIGRDGRLHIAWVDGTGQWHGPIPIGDPVLEPWSGVAAAKQGDDILVAAAIGSGGVLHVAFVNQGGDWQGPVPVGGPVLEPSGGIALAMQGDQLTAAAMGGNGVLHVAWVVGTGDWQGPLPIHGATERICQLTGNYDPEDLPHRNDSTLAGVGGTDLGFPIEHREGLVFLFGDQVGDPQQRDLDPIGISDARQVEVDGFALDYVRTSGEGGRFKPFHVRGVNDLYASETPTGGFSHDGRLWAFLNAKVHGAGDDTQILLASTDDLGSDFELNYAVTYINRDPLGSIGPHKDRVIGQDRLNLAGARVVNNADWPGLPRDRDEGLLIWGQGYKPWAAFLGYVSLPLERRVAADQASATQLQIAYFQSPDPATPTVPRWPKDPALATPLFDVPAVTFLSMSWVPELDRWIAIYTEGWPPQATSPDRGWERPIVLRSSPTPWGPWSDPIELLRPSEAYGRYLHNPTGGQQPLRFAPDDVPIDGWLYSPQLVDRFTRSAEGRTSLYWLLSTGKPYHVQLMRSDVRRRG